MMDIRRVLTVAVVVGSLAGTSVLAGQNNPQQNNPQNRREQERRSQQEQRDIQALVQLIDAVSAGKQPAPTDIPVTWTGNHFVKGAGDATFIPFTVTVDGSKLAAPGVALYVRAVAKGAPARPLRRRSKTTTTTAIRISRPPRCTRGTTFSSSMYLTGAKYRVR